MSAASEQSSPDTKPDPWLDATIVDKFRIDALLGEGAMGRVYRGEHLALKKPIAIKLLHKHLGGDPRVARRFHREAKAASRLSHPNSIQVIDFGEAEDGTLFIAMELLDGRSLQQLIEEEAPFSPARIADLLTQVLRAVDEAHHAGVIHRDLKPENVVVLDDRDGERLKVCDFGIAKIVESEGRTTAITKDGYVCGTPEYMAPEQARGDSLDRRVDVYAAGCVLYQMLCGEVPFRSETALGTITKHLTQLAASPRQRRPEWGIPRSLDRIAMRAIAKSADDRHESAAALAEALREGVEALGPLAEERLGSPAFLEHAAGEASEDESSDPALRETIPAHAPTRPHDHRWLYGLGVAMVVLAVAIGLWTRALLAPSATTTPSASPPAATTDPDQPSSNEQSQLEPDQLDPLAPGRFEPLEPGQPEPSQTTQQTPSEESAALRPAEASPPAPARRHERTPTPSHLAEGRARLLAGDLDGAIESLRVARSESPLEPEVHKQLGRALMRRGLVAEGTAAYRRYLELAPDAPDHAIVSRIVEGATPAAD